VHPSIHRSRVTSPPEPVTLADFPDPGFSKAGSCLGRRRDTAHRIDEFVDLLVGVVGGERGTHSLLQAQSPQGRLRTAVTRAHHDALLVQSLTDLDRVAPGKHERQDTRLVVSGSGAGPTSPSHRLGRSFRQVPELVRHAGTEH